MVRISQCESVISSIHIGFICLQDASIDPSEVFNRIVSSVCGLLTKDEVKISSFMITHVTEVYLIIIGLRLLLMIIVAAVYSLWLHSSYL